MLRYRLLGRDQKTGKRGKIDKLIRELIALSRTATGGRADKKAPPAAMKQAPSETKLS